MLNLQSLNQGRTAHRIQTAHPNSLSCTYGQQSMSGMLYEQRSLANMDRNGILDVRDAQSKSIRIVNKSEHKALNYQKRILQNGRFYDEETGLTVDP